MVDVLILKTYRDQDDPYTQRFVIQLFLFAPEFSGGSHVDDQRGFFDRDGNFLCTLL